LILVHTIDTLSVLTVEWFCVADEPGYPSNYWRSFETPKPALIQQRIYFFTMAHTKSGGSTKLGRDSTSKRLGVKLFDGEEVRPGQIIIRQRGTKFLPGLYVKRGADDTLYAMKAGVVRFTSGKKTKFDGSRRYVKIVAVQPAV